MHRLILSLAPLALLGTVLSASVDGADALAGGRPPTDAALVTAIDLSDSVMRHHEWLQFEGIARAVLHPDFVAAVASGARGRISFSVFTWSSNGRHRLIVPWTLIDGTESALVVATILRQAPRPARPGGGDDERFEPAPRTERRTDLSEAIRFGTSLFAILPRASARRTLNVISNGVDNVGGGAIAARDAAVSAGITINGVALGDDPALVDYFRARVTGGAGSFVMRVAAPEAFADVMRAKFLRDLIARPDLLPLADGPA